MEFFTPVIMPADAIDQLNILSRQVSAIYWIVTTCYER